MKPGAFVLLVALWVFTAHGEFGGERESMHCILSAVGKPRLATFNEQLTLYFYI